MKNVKMILGIVLLTIGISCSKADDPAPTNPTDANIAIETINIPAGTYTMGSPVAEPNRGTDEVEHLVTLSAYKMSKYEITNAQYAAFLNANTIGSNGVWAAGPYPSNPLIYPSATSGVTYVTNQWVPATGIANGPVVNVTWYGATAYAQYKGGRLPTEAEWEYAARATTTTAFNTGVCLSNTQANYQWEFPQTGCTNTTTTPLYTTQTVGSYVANTYGLYDMHGNVLEWCADWYAAYPTAAATNPTGAVSGSNRILRGGGLSYAAQNCRSANRSNLAPTYKNTYIGFRVVF